MISWTELVEFLNISQDYTDHVSLVIIQSTKQDCIPIVLLFVTLLMNLRTRHIVQWCRQCQIEACHCYIYIFVHTVVQKFYSLLQQCISGSLYTCEPLVFICWLLLVYSSMKKAVNANIKKTIPPMIVTER